MTIEQFEDKNLAHYSYAILSVFSHEIVLIDPSRDIRAYLDFAEKNRAKIIGVIETHPHADFVSGHLELYKETGAVIYCSSLLAADYPHEFFDEGDSIEFGKIKLKALNTPGHSPDSISILVEYEGKDTAVFTGDTLFIGDCGRPDLRETTGNLSSKREKLAHQMFHSLRDKLMTLKDEVLVYPTHGAGTLCGRVMSKASSSTIGAEKMGNWALQQMEEDDFAKALTSELPFIPKYFSFDVELNKKGAENLSEAIKKVKTDRLINSMQDWEPLKETISIVDTRPVEIFKNGHLPNSINIIAGEKFETWLGSIISPGEPFYLAAENFQILNNLLFRIAKIGYEGFIKEGFILNYGNKQSPKINMEDFKAYPSNYTIIDVRNKPEVKERSIFDSAVNLPLSELRERLNEIPSDKPIVVHCAGGSRSAAGSSIIEEYFPDNHVYDLSKSIKDFPNKI
ncbi:MAG TPA: rhodanese-like domain-containing protein [Sphingobacteriaceae bacterium]|nr:rhodanese-like domain-containing protein [Sphingobacteriaceae bacterium]